MKGTKDEALGVEVGGPWPESLKSAHLQMVICRMEEGQLPLQLLLAVTAKTLDKQPRLGRNRFVILGRVKLAEQLGQLLPFHMEAGKHQTD